MPKILIADKIDQIAEKILNSNNIDVDIITDLTEEKLIKKISIYEGLIVRSATKVTKKIIESAKNLKVIGRAGAGVDNIDLSIAKKNNIIVMNTPGANANATAEHSVALILSLIRNIPYANSSTHKGNWEKKDIKGIELSNKTLGIIGFGNVSIQLIKLLKGFNLKIQTFSNSFNDRKNEFPNIKNVDLNELVSTSDIISFHCKSPKDGKPIINIEHLKKMKKNTIIINAARGNVINESDLNDALNDDLIAGAAIDVFSEEPAKSSILFNNPKIILTPHIAASTKEAQINVAIMIANQVSDYLLNNKLVNTV